MRFSLSLVLLLIVAPCDGWSADPAAADDRAASLRVSSAALISGARTHVAHVALALQNFLPDV